MKLTGLTFLCAAAVTCLSGCRDRYPTGKLVPVTGTILLNGKPLDHPGSIVFRPDKAHGNTNLYEPSGMIDAEGSYKMFTGKREGAAPGWYQVGVLSHSERNPRDLWAPVTFYVPVKYATPEGSQLLVEVVQRPEPGAYDLKVEGAAKTAALKPILGNKKKKKAATEQQR